MTKKTEKFQCKKCFRWFTTNRGLASHGRMHPWIPAPAPKKETEVETGTVETHNLLNAKGKLDLGDVFWLGRKCVITKITKIEGSNTIEVEARITKKWYSTEEIQ